LVTQEEITKTFEKYNKSQIDEANSIQNKIQYYSIPFTDSNYAPNYHITFLDKIRRKIGNKKAFNVFKENVNYPLPTAEFTKSIFTALSKIFDGDGKNIDFTPRGNYTYPDLCYFKECFERYRIAPNTLIVTNKDNEKVYQHFVDISTVEILKIDKCDIDDVKVLCYKHKDTFIWIDEESIITLDKDKTIIPDKSINHEFGFCPVDFISNIPLSYTKPLIRTNPLVNSLGDLEELLTISVMANVSNKHALPYIVESKKVGSDAGCNYRVGSVYCQNGYLYSSVEGSSPNIVIDVEHNPSKCPVCNKDIGFGATIEINSNSLNADEFQKVADSVLSFKVMPIDTLKYLQSKKIELQDEIKSKILGKTEVLNNAQQHNETRVLATRDDMLSVLFKEKAVFEELMENIIYKSANILDKKLIDVEVSLGKRFFLRSAIEYQDLITKAKENSNNDTSDYENGLIEVQFSENPNLKNRNLFILELEKAGKPFRNMTPTQLNDVFKTDNILTKDFELNSNFYKYLRAVEIEKNEAVENMYLDKDFNKRIELIIQDISNKVITKNE